MNLQEALASFAADKAMLEARGVHLLPGVKMYVPDEYRRDYGLAMDAQPGLSTDPNSAVPMMLTTMIDPQVFKILFSPTKGAEILGEVKKGTWLDETAMFPSVEWTGEVSSYGDFNRNARSGANTNWPQRQSYLFQTHTEYGDRELERAGLARINWVGECDASAANSLNRFANLSYFFGVAGLQNYGLLNDPNLSSSLSPGTKAAGNGNVWIYNGAINATANEVYADIQALFVKLVSQTGGLVEATDKLVLAMSPTSAVALTATNTFNVNVYDLLKKNFPNIRFETAVQYGATSATNPYGVAAGNLVQLIAEEVEGQKAGYCAFNEKLKAHPIVRKESSYRQKKTAGTWGAVIRMPICFASMVGV
jgi:hypothetical protein